MSAGNSRVAHVIVYVKRKQLEDDCNNVPKQTKLNAKQLREYRETHRNISAENMHNYRKRKAQGLMAFNFFKRSVMSVSPCNLQRNWSRCDQCTSDVLKAMNMVGLPSCLIMANTSSLHCCEYCMELGMDLRKDKFFSMQDSRYLRQLILHQLQLYLIIIKKFLTLKTLLYNGADGMKPLVTENVTLFHK
jgi:hypothetical protein